MKCFHCEEPARGVCSFCGRAPCKEHMKNLATLHCWRYDGNKA